MDMEFADWTHHFLVGVEPCHQQCLFAWAVFSSHVIATLSPVPPIPPMVLQLLNRASVEGSSALVDFNNGDGSDMNKGHSYPIQLSEFLLPNWGRSLRVEQDVSLEAFTAAPLRLRRLEWMTRSTAMPLRLFETPACQTLRYLALSSATSALLRGLGRALPALQTLSLQASSTDFELGALVDDTVPRRLADVECLFCQLSASGLSALAALPALTRVYFYSCDLAPNAMMRLSTSRSLKAVELSEVTVRSVEGLERIPSLQAFTATRCVGLNDVSCLAKSGSLVKIDCCRVPLTTTGISGIESIPSLQTLRLSGNQLTFFSRLCVASGLTDLDLSSTLATDEGIAWLETLPALTRLCLKGCRELRSVTCLAGSRSLAQLDLSSTLVTTEGLLGLERISTLTWLSLERTDVTAVNALGDSRSLTDLDVSSTHIVPEGLVGLERIPTLRTLAARSCAKLDTVKCLAASTSLVVLDLQASAVTWAGLEGIHKIATLNTLALRNSAAHRARPVPNTGIDFVTL